MTGVSTAGATPPPTAPEIAGPEAPARAEAPARPEAPAFAEASAPAGASASAEAPAPAPAAAEAPADPAAEAPADPAAEERAEVARQAWTAMRALVLDSQDRRREVADMFGMSFFRVKALLRLYGLGPLTMSELTAALGTDKPYTTVLVDGLEARGLVVRAPHPQDRRSKVVSLTEEGVRAADRTEEVMNRPPAVFAGLDDADLAALARIMRHLHQGA